MNEKSRALKVIEALKKEYPNAECSLSYDDAWKLLVGVRLAAQCTDERVNKITAVLFEKYPDPKALADASAEEIEQIVRPCGLAKSKARDIHACMNVLVYDLNGRVPEDMKGLLALPGVGRKSANLILGDVFGRPAMVCDTHCIRLMNRLGFVSTKDPKKVEDRMWELFPAEEGSDLCHRLVLHGRSICSARTKPLCGQCCMEDICPKIGVN